MSLHRLTSLTSSARLRVAALVTVATFLPSVSFAAPLDLSPAGTQTLDVLGAFGGKAIVSDFWVQPAGTGVFKPFLTLDANGQTSTGSKLIEQAYNTDGFNALYLDGLRPNWNTNLHVSDLAAITINQVNYYGFILDANEPGAAKSVISIDNVRIYTSSTDKTASVGDDLSKLDDLGTLRWAMNSPTTNTDGSFNVGTWILLDAAQENIGMGSNGGSGNADMILYVPVSAFTGASANDYVWFYNLNGVHSNINVNLGSTAGFEEWSAVRSTTPVPDSGSTLILVSLSLAVFGFLARRPRN